MAEGQNASAVQQDASKGAESGLGVIGAVVGAITAAFFAVGNFLTSDRSANAFARQGLDELGTAFGKALPDSIQIDESGSLWNPTQGEIASVGKETNIYRSYDGPTPGEIAERYQPYLADEDRSHDQDQGHDMGY